MLSRPPIRGRLSLYRTAAERSEISLIRVCFSELSFMGCYCLFGIVGAVPNSSLAPRGS